MATATYTGANIATLVELGNTISQAAATAGPDNRIAGTFTVTDVAPYVITSVDATGATRTWRVA